VKRLRAASVDDVARVKGIGAELAGDIVEFLESLDAPVAGEASE
jgi:DNA uptake protein ComE-like DNA-binding protein